MEGYRVSAALYTTIQRKTFVAFVTASPLKYRNMLPPGEQSTTTELAAFPGRWPCITSVNVLTE